MLFLQTFSDLLFSFRQFLYFQVSVFQRLLKLAITNYLLKKIILPVLPEIYSGKIVSLYFYHFRVCFPQ